MPNKVITTTTLAYYDTEKKKVNATKTEVQAVADDLTALDAKVDDIISEGGEPNVIDTVKVNGTALVPDAQKAVDITVPTKTSDLTNDGDGTSNFATESYVQTNGGKIDTISVNGTQQTITNKNVNIEVPTDEDIARTFVNMMDENELQTYDDVQYQINQAVSSVYKYKGSVATYSALPSSGNTTGDVYNVEDTGMNYAWDGTAWDSQGGTVDMSNYWDKTNYTIATAQDIDDILNA